MLRWLILLIVLLPCAVLAQQMAVTIDDVPSTGDLPLGQSRLEIARSMLATLKQQQMPPTYGFLNGIKVEADPETETVLKAWRAAGQPLGNHTWSHLDLESTSPDMFEAEIVRNEPLLERYMAGQDFYWFRYPFLHEGETLEKHRAVRAWLQAHHYRVAEVTMDFEDYLWNAPYARCVAKNDIAAIRQLHDSYLATADHGITDYRQFAQEVYGHDIPYILLLHVGAFDAHMLPELLELYRKRGFTFVSLPEAEQDPVYSVDPDFAYAGGGALTEQLVAKRKLKFPKNFKPYQELEAACR